MDGTIIDKWDLPSYIEMSPAINTDSDKIMKFNTIEDNNVGLNLNWNSLPSVLNR